jgi:NAD-dependent dihydropyrimidine dehydrogenase PreA subunit
MIRDIITIDEERCTGCGLCVPNCPEGALQVIDGTVRLVSDMFCDGLGACIGECPEDAIHVERREAEPYDEAVVIERIIEQGDGVVNAHLEHLKGHGEDELLAIALDHVNRSRETRGLAALSATDIAAEGHGHDGHDHEGKAASDSESDAAQGIPASQLRQWPVQLHLLSPTAPYFRGSDVVIAADCTAYAAGDFHERFLKNRTVAVACPKLDSGLETYREKITTMIDHAEIRSLTVVMMQVPCCRGLLALTQAALAKATRQIPLSAVVLSVEGEVLAEEAIA